MPASEKKPLPPFIGKQFIHNGRGVRVTNVSTDYVQYVTWPEGRGERQMRCWCTHRRWQKKYATATGGA